MSARDGSNDSTNGSGARDRPYHPGDADGTGQSEDSARASGGDRPSESSEAPPGTDGDRLPPIIEDTIQAVLDAAELELGHRRDEVERELRAHFEDGLAGGASADELVRRFGDPSRAGRRIAATRGRGEAGRRSRSATWWASLAEWRSEVVRGARRLGRAPAFSLVVIATLALGVGANAGIFTVLNAVVLEELPYPAPDRLVRLYEGSTENPARFEYVRAPMLTEWRQWNDVFESVSSLYTYRELGADLTDGDRPRRIVVGRVSAGYFETLGVRPALGRTFDEDESFGPGESRGTTDLILPIAIVSHDLWVEHFGGDEDLVGRVIRLDGGSLEVVGVMPAGFTDPFGSQADVWIPQDLRPGGGNHFDNYYLSAVARLQPGITLDEARDRARVLAERFGQTEPEVAGSFPTIVPLHDDIVGSTRARMLWILAAAGILVLLTACLNVANLLLARGLGQDRPLALRSALGAGRGRLVAAILTENGLLAIAGGACGLVVAWLAVRGLTALAPGVLPGIAEVEMGVRVFAFALALTLVALLVFGLAPALRLSRTAPADVLRSGDRSSTVGRAVRAIRDGLVVVQVAVALVLVTGAVLLTRSFTELTRVPLAVDPEGVLTFEVHLPGARYPDGDARHAFHERFQDRLRDLPGVQSVGATSWLPVSGRYHIWGVQWPAATPDGSVEGGEWTSSDVRVIAGDYFETMGIEMLRGSRPAEVDYEAEPVVWINRTLATDVFGEADPVGARIGAAGAIRRVVGIIEDVPYSARGEMSRKLYVPHAQYASNRNWALIQTVRVRGGSDLSDVQAAARRQLAALDGQLVLYRPRSFEGVVDEIRATDRFATSLMAAFAGLALALALLGTYGVLAGSVGARTREIGVRMALGADAASIRTMVLRYAATITLPGIALGLVGAWLTTRWLDALLFGVEPTSAWAYGASVLIFLGVGLASGWIPARRATRVDTVRALAAE